MSAPGDGYTLRVARGGMEMRMKKSGLRLASAGILALLAIMPASANEKAEPDPALSQYWDPIKQVMFGDRVINPDARDVIRVYLNVRADDAATVPVMVKAQIDQTEKDYLVRTIHVTAKRWNEIGKDKLWQIVPDDLLGGAWARRHFRDSIEHPEFIYWVEKKSYSINVGSAERGTLLRDIRIFEFGADGQLLTRTAAAQAAVGKDGTWTLSDVTLTRWIEAGAASSAPEEKLARLEWHSSLSPNVVAAAVLPVTTMSNSARRPGSSASEIALPAKRCANSSPRARVRLATTSDSGRCAAK